MLSHPALQESVYKDIPRLPEVRLRDVSGTFGIAVVEDFDPGGDREGKSVPWPNISKAVLVRDDYRCRICGRGTFSTVNSADQYDKVHFDLEVHHIVPRKDGGTDTFRNLITLCSACHHATFGNSYSGVPVKRERDLFSFERRIYLILPPDCIRSYRGNLLNGTLRDYMRVFDQEELRSRVIPSRGGKINISGIVVTVEEYRKVAKNIMETVDVSDFITMMASFAGNEEKCRFFIDSRGSIIA